MAHVQKKFNIVYAEDSKVFARLVKLCLSSEGFNVTHFEDGEKIVEWIKNNKTDLILLDNEMPVKTGLEIIKEIKSIPEISKIPVIFLTSQNKKENISKGLSYGAVDYILKPFSTEELLLRIRKHLL